MKGKSKPKINQWNGPISATASKKKKKNNQEGGEISSPAKWSSRKKKSKWKSAINVLQKIEEESIQSISYLTWNISEENNQSTNRRNILKSAPSIEKRNERKEIEIMKKIGTMSKKISIHEIIEKEAEISLIEMKEKSIEMIGWRLRYIHLTSREERKEKSKKRKLKEGPRQPSTTSITKIISPLRHIITETHARHRHPGNVYTSINAETHYTHGEIRLHQSMTRKEIKETPRKSRK